jgi:hypothetical protein
VIALAGDIICCTTRLVITEREMGQGGVDEFRQKVAVEPAVEEWHAVDT